MHCTWVHLVRLESRISSPEKYCRLKFPIFKNLKKKAKIYLKTEDLYPPTVSKAGSNIGKKKKSWSFIFLVFFKKDTATFNRNTIFLS